MKKIDSINIAEDIYSKISTVIKIVASNPVKKVDTYSKICIRPIQIKNQNVLQAEQYKQTKVFHINICRECFLEWMELNICGKYKQILVICTNYTYQYLVSANGTAKVDIKEVTSSIKSNQNNRTKNYLLQEGMSIQALVDLGIFTADYKIVKSMYNKYKQINRFIELIDDAYRSNKDQFIRIIDFGCGKSYLTFIVYYYFSVIKKKDVEIIGYDLKEDVVEQCNIIAKKYGYNNLKFLVADVTQDTLYQGKIDMVISLHACDLATDYALYYAINNKAKNIFSVPCCQHQICQSIQNGGDLDILLKFGIVKERVAALLTDSIRSMILEAAGYSVDVIEFVDFEHSPKNIMIRGKLCKFQSNENINVIRNLASKYHFKQELLNLVENKFFSTGDNNE